MRVHLVSPSDSAFGIAVLTPRWLYVIAAATPGDFGDPVVHDETIEQLDPERVDAGDVVGIGIHTLSALRGYELGRRLNERGAIVVYGGIHPSLYPEEAFELGGAHAVVKGDGDVVWGKVLYDIRDGKLQRIYEGGRVSPERFKPARWDLLPKDKYMWASVQTVRGCSKHCSFCSVWRTDGQKPRQRASDAVIDEVIELRRRGFRFILLADDNFYPVSLTDIANAERQNNQEKVAWLKAVRAEKFELMERLSTLPGNLNFFTQITLEAAEDPAFLDAMAKAKIRGALIGIESVTAEGLKSVYKDFNPAGDELVNRLIRFREHGIHVLGSFIFGLPTDREDSFASTLELARKAKLSFAQFVMLMPFAGTVDFNRWEKEQGENAPKIAGIPITRYWLIPAESRPRMFMPHPTMSSEEMRRRTQWVWDEFYTIREVWQRSGAAWNFRARLAYVFVSKLYRQMYATTGISSDNARRTNAKKWARWLIKPCLHLFKADPMPELQVPRRAAEVPAALKVLQ
jgi:radical SAM superfamily enzyme YgiQ (UPF0313 family)